MLMNNEGLSSARRASPQSGHQRQRIVIASSPRIAARRHQVHLALRRRACIVARNYKASSRIRLRQRSAVVRISRHKAATRSSTREVVVCRAHRHRSRRNQCRRTLPVPARRAPAQRHRRRTRRIQLQRRSNHRLPSTMDAAADCGSTHRTCAGTGCRSTQLDLAHRASGQSQYAHRQCSHTRRRRYLFHHICYRSHIQPHLSRKRGSRPGRAQNSPASAKLSLSASKTCYR